MAQLNEDHQPKEHTVDTIIIFIIVCLIIGLANLIVGIAAIWHSHTNRKVLRAIVASNDVEAKKLLDNAVDVYD